MTKQKKTLTPVEYATAMQFVRQYEEKNNRLMEHTAEVALPLISYVNMKIEDMVQNLEQNTPFSMKLRNRGNQAIRACEEFIKTFEGLLVKDGMEAFGDMAETLFPCLDSWFEVTRRGLDVNPPSEVRRRAKLRYHDPYVAKIKECQDSFEDGYEKGYCDCVNDVTRELVKLTKQDIDKAKIIIKDGKVNIEPETKPAKP